MSLMVHKHISAALIVHQHLEQVVIKELCKREGEHYRTVCSPGCQITFRLHKSSSSAILQHFSKIHNRLQISVYGIVVNIKNQTLSY